MIEGVGFTSFRALVGRRKGRRFSLLEPVVVALFCSMVSMAGPVGAQALNVATLDNGAEIVMVTQTLAEVSAGCWPALAENGRWEPQCVVGSDLTFSSVLERTWGDSEAAPPVLVIVGGADVGETVDRFEALVAGRSPDKPPIAAAVDLDEGGQERRMGARGSPSMLRLELSLPSAEDPERTSVEVLWNVLPRVLEEGFPGIRSGIEDDLGFLEFSSDSDVGDLDIEKLRLALAQLAGTPVLEEELVVTEARRLRIERVARLENVERSSRDLLDLWVRGGVDAVRNHLFGAAGVTIETVRRAAWEWLPQHPGHAVLVLPPRHFSPRFAPGPETSRMSNDLTATILERTSAHLATLVLRPILLFDLGGDAEAVVLARLATVLRRLEIRPPYIAVETDPPRLELASEQGGFPGLCEALQRAVEEVSADTNTVAAASGAEGRALELMAGLLGLDGGREVTPAEILSPGNLAIGGVVGDGELAFEALEKFDVGGRPRTDTTVGSTVGGNLRSRAVVAGGEASVAVALPVVSGFPVPRTIAEILSKRVEDRFEDAAVEVLLPLVPGRRILVLVVTRKGSAEGVEEDLRAAWDELFGPVGEDAVERGCVPKSPPAVRCGGRRPTGKWRR